VSDDDTQAVKRLGYWATIAWAVVAFLVGQFVPIAFLLLWKSGEFYSSAPYDGRTVTLFILISNPITIAVLIFAVWRRRVDIADYLGLVRAEANYVTTGINLLIVLIAASDALLFVCGQPLVTQFQLQSYTSAIAEGWRPALLVAAIIVAPAGEEIMFRGFLFRGFVTSERSGWPAIAIISILWAALHVQYDLFGAAEIFVIGLFLGWVRWRSGSLLLTFLLHALFNLEASLETVLQIKFFP
jgi:membrane protease YdiL (CAAX protease family)